MTKVNGSRYVLMLLGEVIKGLGVVIKSLGVMIGVIKDNDNEANGAEDTDTNA